VSGEVGRWLGVWLLPLPVSTHCMVLLRTSSHTHVCYCFGNDLFWPAQQALSHMLWLVGGMCMEGACFGRATAAHTVWSCSGHHYTLV